MRNHHGTCLAGRMARKIFLLSLASAISLTCVSIAKAQKEKKKKPDTSQPADSSKMLVPMTDEQQIDYTLSEMLGAWQLGDVEKLHKNYADDVVVVSGVERDVPAGLGYCSRDVDRGISIEGCNLDGGDSFDVAEPPPKRIRQPQSSHGWLQVEAEYGYDFGYGPHMGN